MKQVKAGLQYVFQTRNTLTFVMSGAGHTGMEGALTNLVESGDSVLVCEHGMWGLRAADIAERQGAVVHKLVKPLGQCFTDLLEIEEALKTYSPTLLFICHGESSTGVLQPLEGLGELCHKYSCLLLVDTVASLCAVPFKMDEWLVDCVYAGSQKALSCPPGLAPISFSDRAWYHHTAPINLVYGLREGLAKVAKEGLENSIKRHEDNALVLHREIEDMGLQLFVKDKKLRLPCLTTIEVPQGINWKAVTEHLMKKHMIELAGGLGPSVGLVWRIGLMGYNSNLKNVEAVINGMKDALAQGKAKLC